MVLDLAHVRSAGPVCRMVLHCPVISTAEHRQVSDSRRIGGAAAGVTILAGRVERLGRRPGSKKVLALDAYRKLGSAAIRRRLPRGPPAGLDIVSRAWRRLTR